LRDKESKINILIKIYLFKQTGDGDGMTGVEVAGEGAGKVALESAGEVTGKAAREVESAVADTSVVGYG
jgi:hypothetical protein